MTNQQFDEFNVHPIGASFNLYNKEGELAAGLVRASKKSKQIHVSLLTPGIVGFLTDDNTGVNKTMIIEALKLNDPTEFKSWWEKNIKQH